jgi:hypothetical protein
MHHNMAEGTSNSCPSCGGLRAVPAASAAPAPSVPTIDAPQSAMSQTSIRLIKHAST